MATLAVLGCLDTKGHEHAFVAEAIRRLGHTPLLIDAGTLDRPQVPPDIRASTLVPSFTNAADRGSCVA